MARITYHGHSGFSVRTASRLLIFDYLGKGLNDPKPEDRAVAFISHAHSDHCHPLVSYWARQGLCHLAVGEDVQGGEGVKFSPGDSRVIEGVIVRAYGSTDQGVSFWVEADGLKLFHAGDFNWWHWRDEGDAAWTERAGRAFEAILHTMAGMRADVAFFPVDPRMGAGAADGAMRFIELVKPKLILPMHFWDEPQAALDFAQREMPSGVRAAALTKPGEWMDIR